MILRMKKRSRVRFSFFEVYFFGRCLGTDKVPESGNNPLGMDNSHFFTTKVNIYQNNITEVLHNGDNICTSTPQPKNPTPINIHSVHPNSHDRDSLQSILSIDYTTKSLQPMNPKQRIKCLKDAGVEFVKDKISVEEGKDLIKLRLQRQQVGCKCTGKNNCNPEKCICNKEGIPCQSDSTKFPCKCGPNCGNVHGKRVYSHLRTKYHYRHTFERNLFMESDTCGLSIMGDCQICNDISEEVLKEIFQEPVLANRKRGANVQDKDMWKPQKPKEAFSETFSAVVNSSRILPVKNISISPQLHSTLPIIYNDLFTFVKSTEKGAEKENLYEFGKIEKLSDNRIISFASTIAERSTLSPIQLSSFTYIPTTPSQFCDSLSNIEMTHGNVSDLNITISPLKAGNITTISQDYYWSSFLNTESFKLKDQSPLIMTKSILNPISLAAEVSTPLHLKSEIFQDDKSAYISIPTKVSLSDDAVFSPIILDSIRSKIQSYKLRRSTIGNPFYYESPLDKNIKKKRFTKIYNKISRCDVKETKNDFMNIEQNATKDEDETDSLIDNIAEISLIKFVDITSLSDKEPSHLEPVVEVARGNSDERI